MVPSVGQKQKTQVRFLLGELIGAFRSVVDRLYRLQRLSVRIRPSPPYDRGVHVMSTEMLSSYDPPSMSLHPSHTDAPCPE